MAFCSNCGAPISEGTKFCPECGQRIETPEPVNTAPEQGEYQSTYTAPEQGEYQSAYTEPEQGEYQSSYTAPEQGEYQSAYTEPEQGEYQSSYRAPEQGEYQSAYVPPQQNAPLAGQKKSMNINPKLLIGAAAAVVLLLVLFLVLGGKKKPENSGSTGSDTGVTAPSVPGETENAESGGITDLQKQWNGTWYGCMYVSEATGDFAGIPDKYYDVYMVVEVDGQGKGQFAVYLAGVEEAFALADCEAKAEGLYATEGTVAGGVDMDTYNWMFLPMPDYPDQYAMGDVIEDGDSVFDFKLFVKQWGGSWQDEIDSDFAIVPPSVDRYMAAIADGELPPVGFAPIEYEGTNPASADGGDILDKPGNGEEAGEDSESPEEPGAPEGDYGMSTPDADGIVPLDVLVETGKWLDEYRSEASYEDVYNRMGGVHGYPMTDSSNWKEGFGHPYQWSAESGEYVIVNFKPDENGVEKWSSMSSTAGLLK